MNNVPFNSRSPGGKLVNVKQALPGGDGALIGSIASFSGLNIPTMADFKLSTYYFNVSLGRDAHNWLFQAGSHHTTASSSFFPFLLHFPSNDGEKSYNRCSGKDSQGTELHMEFCSLVSSLGFCFASPPVHNLLSHFQWNLEFQESLQK